MSNEEMSRIFALMMLAWPNAPMFQRGKIEPTIRLWTFCLPEVDFLTGQMAAVQLCRTCKFPPTIADMRQASEDVRNDIEHRANDAVYFANARGGYTDAYTPRMLKDDERRRIYEEMSLELRGLPNPEPGR